jgi:hypothetical protein
MKYLVFLLFSINTCFGQDFFEGQIKYKVTVVKKDKTTDPKMLEEYDNKVWTYDFKNGNFKWSFPSTFWLGHIYNQKENKFYFLSKGSDLATWQNGKKLTDSIINIKTVKTNVQILKQKCDLLTIKTKYLTQNIVRTRSYYYSSKFRIDPKWFAQYKSNNFDMIYKLTKAVPLKITDDFGTFQINYEAIEIKPKILNISTFTIDPKLRLEEL